MPRIFTSAFWLIITALFLFPARGFAQDSWKNVLSDKKGEIIVIAAPASPPFIYSDENNEFQGIEKDLLFVFRDFVHKRYGVDLKIKFEKKTRLLSEDLLFLEKAPSGYFLSSAVSTKNDRKKQVKFSPVFLPDIDILISSGSIPEAKDTADFVRIFKNMSAYAYKGTTQEEQCRGILKMLPGGKLKLNTISRQLSRRQVSEDSASFTVDDLLDYILDRKAGLNLKRQWLFLFQHEGFAWALSKNSDWDEPLEAFFADQSFGLIRNHIIRRHLGDEIPDLLQKIAGDSSAPERQLDILKSEYDIQEHRIVSQKLEALEQKSLRNYLIISVIFVALIGSVIYWRYLNKAKNHRLLQEKNNLILIQKNDLAERTIELQSQNEEIAAQRDSIDHQNQLLNRQNTKITDSIRAANVIQNAMLPDTAMLSAAFSEHFILFKPKDIVSGDFYWTSRTENRVYVVVADCTGHGVPGALMAMAGVFILNEIVNVKDVGEPARILGLLHENILKSFKAGEETKNMQGMDICLVRADLHEEGAELTFAGAKNPLYYFTNGGLQTLKGDRLSIGSAKKEHFSFSNQTLSLRKGDLIYLTTDGFIDIPDAENHRFGSQKLKELLESNAHLPAEEQEKKLTEISDRYHKDVDQRDDITVVGIRI